MTDAQKTLSFRSRGLILLVAIIVVVAIDQATKFYALEHWQGRPPQSFFGDLFRIDFAYNKGAFLGLGAGLTESARFWILIVVNGVMLVGLTLFLMATRQITFWTFLALGLIVAGGIGNMIDRVRLQMVIDFWNIGIGGLRSGIFNVADMAISAGFLMLLPTALFGESDSSKKKESKKDQA